MSTLRFISDTHFGHEKMAERRGWSSVKSMDEHMISRWNSVVKKGDMTVHVGDFAHNKVTTKQVNDILMRLNGQVHLVLGNHDRKAVRKSSLFAWIGDKKIIKHGGFGFFCLHYAMRSWAGSRKGVINIHGHSHGKLPIDPYLNQIDVGVDCFDYTPIRPEVAINSILVRRSVRA